MRTYGSRRVVRAFGPTPRRRTATDRRADAPSGRHRRERRQDTAEIQTVREKLTEAVDLLGRIDEIKRLSGLVSSHATRIDKEADVLRAGLDRLLGQAVRRWPKFPRGWRPQPDRLAVDRHRDRDGDRGRVRSHSHDQDGI